MTPSSTFEHSAISRPEGTKPWVSILAADLSNNSVNRPYRLAQALQPWFSVEVVGYTFTPGDDPRQSLWAPLRTVEDVPIRVVPAGWFPGFLSTMRSTARSLRGEVIIAHKLRQPSLGTALLTRRMRGTPVILDIDDHEPSITGWSRWERFIDPNGMWWTDRVQDWHREVDESFVVSEVFRQRYGGMIVPHPMDPAVLDPDRYDRDAIRHAIGIRADETIIGFIGTPAPHKGIDVIFSALERMDVDRVRIMVVGARPDGAYERSLQARLGDRLLMLPMQPVHRLPEFLVAADIIALPQRRSSVADGQMPAKLTDAMAMARPVIASDCADIGKYLKHCGVVVAPDDDAAFTAGLSRLIAEPDWARALGQQARAYFMQHLSMQAVGTLAAARIHQLMRSR